MGANKSISNDCENGGNMQFLRVQVGLLGIQKNTLTKKTELVVSHLMSFFNVSSFCTSLYMTYFSFTFICNASFILG
jgi:hypothetical protein